LIRLKGVMDSSACEWAIPKENCPRYGVMLYAKPFARTGTPCEKRDVSTWPILPAQRNRPMQTLNAPRLRPRLERILGSVVKAKREGDFSKD